jgi:hypothetical protein
MAQQHSIQPVSTSTNKQSLTDNANTKRSGEVAITPPRWWAKPDWWILAVATLTAFVIGWQSWETRKSASASEKSVLLLIEEKRARIVVAISEMGHSLEFSGKNIGGTNARVAYAYGFSQTIRSDSSLPEMPSYISIEHRERFIDWIAPGEVFEIKELNGDERVSSHLVADLSSDATRNNLQLYGWSLWVYGRVGYSDGLSKAYRETRFCYRVAVDKHGNTLAHAEGPEQYWIET